MRKHIRIVTAVLLFALCVHANGQSKTETTLLKEKSNLLRTTDAVARTRISIKISDLLIVLLTTAARTEDDKLVELYLTDYANTIQNAQLTMMKTGRDAHKHPAGFKDLEISLRKQQHLLT